MREPTLRAVLRASARRLAAAKISFGHGTTNAQDEAAWLTLHALGLAFEDLAANLDRKLGARERARVAALVDERIRTRKPAAYVTHEAWLGEHRFYVDERALVPRSFIAEILREDLAPWIARPRAVRTALDLCTGSGCLAILLALSFRNARVDGADLSTDALEVARVNVARYRLGRRVRVVKSDLYDALDRRHYDVIVSNPPYVTAAAMRRLPAEYRREPPLALAGGRDGLALVRRIVDQAPEHLQPRGLLVVEVGHARARIEAAYPRMPFVWAETSGGDDNVLLITREALLAGRVRPARSRRAR